VAEPRFVVQLHRARRIHYDLRFEMDAALVSWAVPKGPTLDPDVRRAAFHVDDHPLDYFDFEGIIPAGTYGGGDVLVWDVGTYRAPKSRNPRRSVDNGELHVELFGQKLRGTFVLVRTGEDNQWLMLHKHDEFAVPGWSADDYPRSVLTGRTSDEIAADPDRLWRSDLPATEASIPLKFSGPSPDELRVLDGFGASGRWHIHGRELAVSGLDRTVLPGRGRGGPVTKRDLLRHAARLGPTVLPYLSGRAFALPRAVPAGAPAWLTRIEVDGRAGLEVTEPAALVWAVNAGAVEWRVSAARTDRLDRPDVAVVDVDAGERSSWADLRELVGVYRTALDHLGLAARPEITGRRRLQVWIPIRPGPRAEQVEAWVAQLARTVAAVVPDLAGRPSATEGVMAAPYGPRREPGAPVVLPIEWDELDDPRLTADRITLRSLGERIEQRGDLFRAALDRPQVLPDLADPG
jgi:bifunctional non-homologous end joining protein LigD